MGRRALKKIDPSLDLSRWLLNEEQLASCWSKGAIFDRPAPLEIEMGSGKGLFMSTATQARPEHNFLGIEIAGKYARHCAARLARQSCPNGRMVHGDGVRVFGERLPDELAHAVHVYFPDPWWKARHRRRRVMRASFVHDVERVLVPGGVLHFWTDVREYYDATLELIQQESTLLGPIVPAPQSAAHDLDYRTHFERRMRLHGQAVFRSEFHKRP